MARRPLASRVYALSTVFDEGSECGIKCGKMPGPKTSRCMCERWLFCVMALQVEEVLSCCLPCTNTLSLGFCFPFSVNRTVPVYS